MPDIIISRFMIIKQLFLCWIMALTILTPFLAHAQVTPMNQPMIGQFKQKLMENTRNTNSIVSDFTQVKEMSMLAEKITSKGKFTFRKEKMLRWEYTEPFSYLIILRNDQISIRDENSVNHFNVSSNKVFLEINRIILGTIQGNLLEDTKNFQASFFENATSFMVKLHPLNKNLAETLSEIVIYFNKTNYSVDKLEMKEPGGDLTKISFHGKSFNKPISDENFIIR